MDSFSPLQIMDSSKFELRKMKVVICIFAKLDLHPLYANPTKWPNTFKQFVGKLPTNCLNVFGHFVGLALKGLS